MDTIIEFGKIDAIKQVNVKTTLYTMVKIYISDKSNDVSKVNVSKKFFKFINS